MFQKLKRNLERHLWGRDPKYHDPYDDPAEQFYARIYLKQLFERMDAEFRHQSAKVLDVGCHTGRLSVPLARASHDVTGIDSSRFHVRRAEQHAREAGTECRFLKGDGFRFVQRTSPGSFDLVLCTEVLYQRPDFRARMQDLARTVREGGLLATSHRTRFFYLTRAIRERDFETSRALLNAKEGVLWGSYFNWQTPEELEQIYREMGMEIVSLRPIGVFSGNGEEGMSALFDVGQAEDSARDALFDLEAHESLREFAAEGRYLFAIGRKLPPAGTASLPL